MALFGGGARHIANEPKDMDLYRHPVAHGDIFLLATDGVWDNLFNEDLLKIVSHEMMKEGAWIVPQSGQSETVGKLLAGAESEKNDQSLSSKIARAVVSEARKAAYDTRRDSPFAKEARIEEPGARWTGGKIDDICVVVGVVIQDGL
jgi:protein phosphatase PTC7